MMLANDGWTDEARDASLAVRRAKMIERKRAAFFEANPGASESDWKQHDAMELAAWRKRKDAERWLKENPGKTEADWNAYDAQQLDAWKKKRDEEKGQGPRKAGSGAEVTERKRVSFFKANPDATEADWQAEDARGLAEWRKRKEKDEFFEYVPGATEEEWQMISTPPTEKEMEVYTKQHNMQTRDKPYVENWVSSDGDGVLADPHWGDWSEDAPYGYHDQTGEPRKEPLYDIYGRPIVPRLPDSEYRTRAEREGAMRGWLERSDQALKELGYWGEGSEGNGEKLKWGKLKAEMGMGREDGRQMTEDH